MKKKQLALIVAGVVGVHAAVFLVLANWKVAPVKSFWSPAKDGEFAAKTITYVDGEGEPQKVVKEFTVSTKLSSEPQIPQIQGTP